MLRDGALSEADIDRIAEEIESMGRAEKRELISRLAVLLANLLKWQHQPERRGASWEVTITNQRRALVRHLADNPSLKSRISDALTDAYGDARGEARAETGLPANSFQRRAPGRSIKPWIRTSGPTSLRRIRNARQNTSARASCPAAV